MTREEHATLVGWERQFIEDLLSIVYDNAEAFMDEQDRRADGQDDYFEKEQYEELTGEMISGLLDYIRKAEGKIDAEASRLDEIYSELEAVDD